MGAVDLSLTTKGIKPVRNGHPWVFRNALIGRPADARLDPSIQRILFGPDALVWEHCRPAIVRDGAGTAIGWGAFNPASRLAVRVLSRDCSVIPTSVDLSQRIRRAIDARAQLFADPDNTAFRLVFGEADEIPGLAVDLFGNVAVAQFSGAFAWDNRDIISASLIQVVSAYGIDATFMTILDNAMLAKEGLRDVESGQDNRGKSSITVVENGLKWFVEPTSGQKTGHYCDQRENRRIVATEAVGRRVLDLCSYHGGFALTALAHGAREAVCVDSSATALERLKQNASLQGSVADVTAVRGDAFAVARRGSIEHNGLTDFDLIVLDPPKLVSQRRELDAGLRAYKDLNLSVMRHARPGAKLATFSCSGAVGRGDFQRVLAWAAKDAGRRVVIERTLSQSCDHPIPLSFPDAEYLTGFLLRVE